MIGQMIDVEITDANSHSLRAEVRLNEGRRAEITA
jgi:hypothetical protein